MKRLAYFLEVIPYSSFYGKFLACHKTNDYKISLNFSICWLCNEN